MSSTFEDLSLAPELVEALAAEGIDRPTPLQAAMIPVVRRGNNVVASAGPGAGTLVAYGIALVDRLDPETEAAGPLAIVLVPSAGAARELAEWLGSLTMATGHTVAALGTEWVMPQRAQILFAAPTDLLEYVERSLIDLGAVQAVVLDGAGAIEASGGLEAASTLLEAVPEGQRVALSLPRTKALDALVEGHFRRAVSIPPRAVDAEESGPDRGSLKYRVCQGEPEAEALSLAADLLGSGEARHLALFVRSDDRAADVGDYLSLYGYVAGSAGSDEPIWMVVDELEHLASIESAEELMVISVDVPFGVDALDRRHGGGRGGIVLVRPRELAHLKETARLAGYALEYAPLPTEDRVADDLVATVESVERAIQEEDIAAYMRVLESLFQEHDPAEVAAAAVALLRKRIPPTATPSAPAPDRAMSWVRLYVSVGTRDGAGPGDVVGAIAGEAQVDPGLIGKIDLRENFSVVEVESSIAPQVIKGLNGTTVKGRSVRVDYDRGPAGGKSKPPPRGRPTPRDR